MSAYQHIKSDVLNHEYNMHNYIYNMLGDKINLPKPIHYNRSTLQLSMEMIPGLSVADSYGDEATDCPERVMNEIRRIIRILKEKNIIYPDITGYNFIETSDGKVWIIDFEHCYFDFQNNNDSITISDINFVDKFISGYNIWNFEFV